MADSSPATKATEIPRNRHRGRARLIALAILFAVLIASAVFSWMTRDAMAHLQSIRSHAGDASANRSLVDQSPWQTAQALAPLAVSTEEVALAHEAERLADHEVDQAFAAALRKASIEHRELTGDALALSQKVAQLQQVVDGDQAALKRLQAQNTSAGKPPAPTKADTGSESTGDDLDILKAQLGLDTDVLTDAQQQLAQASGDQRAEIQQELAAHEAAMTKFDSAAHGDGEVALLSVKRNTTLYSRVKAWFAQLTRHQLLQQAIQQTNADATRLAAEYANLQAESKNQTSPNPPQGPAANLDHAARLALLTHQSEQRQLINLSSDRVQTEKQLAALYSKWLTQLDLQHRILLHLILNSVIVIALILIAVILAIILVRQLTNRPTLDERRARTLRNMLELAINLTGFALILLNVFGVPRQISTILGLATAGLTVALQDFILAFLGWFVLIGKNGIHIGDSVEIDGVPGEVTEVGLFRTTLLETGNSTDQGHPTGRHVTFLNKFAINGRFFNFSTAGQWMWDEIPVLIPETPETYTVIAEIQKAIAEETGKDASLAEQEWKRASRRYGLAQFSAEPQVNLRPASNGVNILVRYVTRASDRFQTRNRLYQTILDVLHKPAAETAPASESA